MNSDERSRIAVVETEVKSIKGEVTEIKKDVKEIRNNHLPHMTEKFENKLESVSNKVGEVETNLIKQILTNKSEVKETAIKLSVVIAIIVLIISISGPIIVNKLLG